MGPQLWNMAQHDETQNGRKQNKEQFFRDFRWQHLVTVILLWAAIALVAAFVTLSAATVNQVYTNETAAVRRASSLKHLAQETGVTNEISRTATKLFKLHPLQNHSCALSAITWSRSQT